MKRFIIQTLFTMVLMFRVGAIGIVFGPYCGAVSDSSALILYKLDSNSASCRLRISDSPMFKKSTYSTVVNSSIEKANIIKIPITGLKENTKYYYSLEIDGVVTEEGKGEFRTFPKKAQKIQFAFGNSLKKDSENSGLVAALENDIQFFLCTGDLFYQDININNLDTFRCAYKKVLTRKDVSLMGKKVPFVYMWDDHDYGPNNSDRAAKGRTASRRAYRESIPHYPLVANSGDDPIYQSFSIGSIRFILTDLRSERDKNSDKDTIGKSMMGDKQYNWFLNELKNSSMTHDLIFWVSTVPYTASTKIGGDDWGGFSYERRNIANFIKQNKIDNLMIISGDAHCIAAGDGNDSDYATGGGAPLAEVLAAPLNNNYTSIKGGPWSQGTYEAPSNKNVYGLITVHFANSETLVEFSGRDNNHKEMVSLKKRFVVITK